MPTGYTYPVCEGKITEFPDFAMSCARAFGALIMMRDEPSDAPIPEEFRPSDYNSKRLEESRERLAKLNAMTTAEAVTACETAFAEASASHEKYEAECVASDARLKAMLAKVDRWEPPTASHVEMKKFMIDQLATSLRGSYRPIPPAKLEPTEWHRSEIEKAMKDIGYHAEAQAQEIERAAGRTEWIKQLRASLEQNVAA